MRQDPVTKTGKLMAIMSTDYELYQPKEQMNLTTVRSLPLSEALL